MEYKVGDRVKHEKYGKGTVVEINSGATKDTVLVQFDNENESLHSGCECRGTYKNNTCWHFNNSYLEDIEKIDRYEGLELLNEIKKQEIKNCEIKVYKNNKYQFTIQCGEKAILDNPQHHIGMLTSDKYTYEPIIKKEMTISEIEKELGYSIKIVKD